MKKLQLKVKVIINHLKLNIMMKLFICILILNLLNLKVFNL